MDHNHNIINQHLKFYQQEKNVNDIFFIEKINILNKIHNTFINKMIKEISIFTNKNVCLSSYSMKIGCDRDSIKIFQALKYFNLIETLPYKEQLYVIFSSTMLFVITDILFGGNNNSLYHNKKYIGTTTTESFVNEKLICFFKNTYAYAWKKNISSNMNFVDIKKFKKFNKLIFFSQDKKIVHRFLLKVNQIYFCFYLLTPISILNVCEKKNDLIARNNICSGIIQPESRSIKDIIHVKLNVIVQLFDFALDEKDIFTFSVGDVLSIKNPQKIMAYIDNVPVFSGCYAVFSKRSCIIIKKFINIKPIMEEKEKLL